MFSVCVRRARVSGFQAMGRTVFRHCELVDLSALSEYGKTLEQAMNATIPG
jgi:hypothetical protein